MLCCRCTVEDPFTRYIYGEINTFFREGNMNGGGGGSVYVYRITCTKREAPYVMCWGGDLSTIDAVARALIIYLSILLRPNIVFFIEPVPVGCVRKSIMYVCFVFLYYYRCCGHSVYSLPSTYTCIVF